jgi:hypothetical protein
MSKNSHGRKPKPKPKRPTGDDSADRVHDVRRAYKRPHPQEWQGTFEDEEVEELEDFDELSDIEDDELDDLERSIEPDEEERD